MSSSQPFVADTDSAPELDPEVRLHQDFEQHAQHWCTQPDSSSESACTDLVHETDPEEIASDDSEDEEQQYQRSMSLLYHRVHNHRLRRQQQEGGPSTSREGSDVDWPRFIQNADQRDAYFTHLSPSEHDMLEETKKRTKIQEFHYYRRELAHLQKQLQAIREPEPPGPTIHDLRVHISCSAEYSDDGYPDVDEPRRELGHPAVVSYRIQRYRVDRRGACTPKVSCGEDFPRP